MRTHAARFLGGAGEAAKLPRLQVPEVAFAGRSNVGKSSLLTRLVGQRQLARVGRTPGRTQQINVFLIDERLTFADLPGYGFARVPLQVKEGWKHLVEGYLTGRRQLRLVVVLVDLRRGIEEDDAQLFEYLHGLHRPMVLVATKADKLRRGERQRAVRQIAASLPPEAACIVCSSATGEGVEQVWRCIERHVTGAARERSAPQP
jgi:GTP-binding protein